MYNEILSIILILMLIFSLLLEIISFYIVIKFSHPKSNKSIENPEDYGIKNYEKINFKSIKKDVNLHGYFMKKEENTKAIIICHGYGDNKFKDACDKVDQLKLSKLFLDCGYNVLIFDFRGHGEYAEGNSVTIGFNEQQDLLGAIDFIKSKKTDVQIGLIGFSMGAATSLSVLDKTQDISFAIADSPFSDLKDYLKVNMSIWTNLPRFPFTPMVLANFKLIYGVDFSKVSPVISASKTEIPLLIIHSKADKIIPYTESLKIAKNFKNKLSKLVLFPDSTHAGSYELYEKQYKEVLQNFLKLLS